VVIYCTKYEVSSIEYQGFFNEWLAYLEYPQMMNERRTQNPKRSPHSLFLIHN